MSAKLSVFDEAIKFLEDNWEDGVTLQDLQDQMRNHGTAIHTLPSASESYSMTSLVRN